MKFYLGYNRNRLEGGQHDFKWKQSEFTKISYNKI